MAISPERRAQIDALVAQRRQGGGMTPERRAQIDALVAQRMQPQAPQGPAGALGVASGAAKTIVDAPRQFAESGRTIGKTISDSPFGQFFQRNITKPLVGLLAPDQKERLGQVARAGQQVIGASTTPVEALERRTGAEKLGETAANIGMLLAPGGIAKGGAEALAGNLPKLGRFAQPVARGIAEGISGGVMTAGQTGDIGKATGAGLLDAAVTGGLGVAGRAISGIGRGTRLKIPGKTIEPAIEQAARRTGTKLPASALSENSLVRLIEQNSAQGFGGKQFRETVDAATTRLNDYANNISRRAGVAVSPTEAGKILSEGLDGFRKSFISQKEEIYKGVRSGIIDAGKMTPEKSVGFIRPIVNDLLRAAETGGDVPQLQFWAKKLAGLTGQKQYLTKNITPAIARRILNNTNIPAEVDLASVRSLLRDLSQRSTFGDIIQTGDKAALSRFAATLSDEFDTALTKAQPELAEQLAKANEAYRAGLETLQSPAAQSIARLTDRPDKLFDRLVSPTTSAEEITQIMNFAGERANDIRAGVIDHILKKSMRNGEIRGTFLETALRNYGPERLQKILTPQQIRALTDVSTVAKALKSGQKIAEGSQTAFSQRLWAVLAGAFFNPLLAMKLLVADGIIGKGVLSPQGQKVLLEGINIQPLTEAVGGAVQKSAPSLGAFTAGANYSRE